MYFSRSLVKGGLFCSTFPSVPVLHLMMANMHSLKMYWKIRQMYRADEVCLCGLYLLGSDGKLK